MTSSITSGPTIDSRASTTAAAHGAIFSASVPGQEAEVLAADRVERAEHDDPLVRALLEHGVEPGGEREHALAGAGVAAEADDADSAVGEQVDGDALLGRAAADVEHRVRRRARGAPACRRAPGRAPTASRRAARRRCCTAGRGPRRGRRPAPRSSSSISAGLDVELDEAGPARVGRQLVAVLVGVEADDARLQAQRQVLGDDGDVARPRWPGCGRRRGCGGRCRPTRRATGRPARSWWLSSTRSVPPPSLTGSGPDERAVLGPQVLQRPQRLAGRPAQLGVVALAPRAR